jgi:hypothetical protein
VNNDIYSQKIVILDCSILNEITITLANRQVYRANLYSDFKDLFCYPKNLDEWSKAKVIEGGFAIEWPTGFDIHFDHIIALSEIQKKYA